MMPPTKKTDAIASTEYLALGFESTPQKRRRKPGLLFSMIVIFRCGRAARAGFQRKLLRQDPLHEVLDLHHVLGRRGLHVLVLLFVAIRELGLLAGGDVLDEALLGIGRARV